MGKDDINRIADSLSDDEKPIVRILGKYEAKDKSKRGMPAGALEDELGFKMDKPRPVLESVLAKRFVQLRLSDGRVCYKLPVDLDQDSVLSAYRESCRFGLTPEGYTLFRRLTKGEQAEDKKQATPEIDIIEDFCNWTDELIAYIKHPDKSREISKPNADSIGRQINNLAKKIWPQDNFDETGRPYESTAICECENLSGEGVFGVQQERKEQIIQRLEQWKARALKDKSKIQEQLKMQIKQEGVLEPKPPESLQKLLWIWKHGRKHWRLILLAIAIFLVWSILAKFDLMSRIYTLIRNMFS